MRQPMLNLGWAERVNIKADVLAVFAVLIALEGADLVEGTAKVIASKRFVLVELKPVLVVEVQRPKLAEGHGEIDFIGWVKSRKDCVGRLDQAPDPLGIGR